jgi:hypothetical protein
MIKNYIIWWQKISKGVKIIQPNKEEEQQKDHRIIIVVMKI